MSFVIVTSLECEWCGPDVLLILDPDSDDVAICPDCGLTVRLDWDDNRIQTTV